MTKWIVGREYQTRDGTSKAVYVGPSQFRDGRDAIVFNLTGEINCLSFRETDGRHAGGPGCKRLDVIDKPSSVERTKIVAFIEKRAQDLSNNPAQSMRILANGYSNLAFEIAEGEHLR